MRVLHTADVHLRNDSDLRWHALTAVLEKAKALAADVVTIGGDLFDRDVDAQQMKSALRALFESSGLRVLILPGNHDNKGIRAGDFYGEHVSVMADARQSVDIGDVRFIPLPFSEGGADRTLERLYGASELCASGEGKCNILLYHGELLDLVPGGGAFGEEDPDYMPVRLASFDGLGFAYVLAGHFHKGFAVHQYEDGYFVYAGSPASISVKETGLRHVGIVDIGEPPRQESLDTHHFERVVVRLDPFDTAHPVDAVDERLRNIHPRAEVLLSIDGFVDLSTIGLTESELYTEIKKAMARWPVKDIEPCWTDVRDVIDHELFKKFNAQLERLARPESPATAGNARRDAVALERRAELQNLVLQSLMELVNAH